jgi:tRNA (mo5U34)-methyltransferase
MESTVLNPVADEIESMGPWFHNLHLPDGRQTAPNHLLGDFPQIKWEQMAPYIPEQMDGWKVLDIGCNAGFYSFEFARRGAEVLGIDREPLYLNQANWAARIYGLDDRVEFRQMQVYELAGFKESFDVILFLGVFYHLRYPGLALDIVSQIVTKFMLFQTLTIPGQDVYARNNLELDERNLMLKPGWPKMAFIEEQLAGDETNWWAPNHACIEAMLRASGMRVAARPGDEIYMCEPDPVNLSVLKTWDEEEYMAATGQIRNL